MSIAATATGASCSTGGPADGADQAGLSDIASGADALA